MAYLGKARSWTCTSTTVSSPEATSFTTNQRAKFGILSRYKWTHKTQLLLSKLMHVPREKYHCWKPWFAPTDKSSFLLMQSAWTVGLNSCTCIQGSKPFPSLMHSPYFHWKRLLHCCFSMDINFSDLTCCFRTQFHSTVDFHMCCNVCISKQCLGNHIRVAEIQQRKACFLIFFFWRPQMETRNKRRWPIYPNKT